MEPAGHRVLRSVGRWPSLPTRPARRPHGWARRPGRSGRCGRSARRQRGPRRRLRRGRTPGRGYLEELGRGTRRRLLGHLLRPAGRDREAAGNRAAAPCDPLPPEDPADRGRRDSNPESSSSQKRVAVGGAGTRNRRWNRGIRRRRGSGLISADHGSGAPRKRNGCLSECPGSTAAIAVAAAGWAGVTAQSSARAAPAPRGRKRRRRQGRQEIAGGSCLRHRPTATSS